MLGRSMKKSLSQSKDFWVSTVKKSKSSRKIKISLPPKTEQTITMEQRLTKVSTPSYFKMLVTMHHAIYSWLGHFPLKMEDKYLSLKRIVLCLPFVQFFFLNDKIFLLQKVKKTQPDDEIRVQKNIAKDKKEIQVGIFI